jgi:hypothetical protein
LLYVTTELNQTVTLIDPKTLKIVGYIPTGQPESHMLALSHDGTRGYTANVGPGTVSVLDISGPQGPQNHPISANTQRIAISPDDRWVFTADQTKPQLAVIDTTTNSVAWWIRSKASPTAPPPPPTAAFCWSRFPIRTRSPCRPRRPCRYSAPSPSASISAGSHRPPGRQGCLRLLRNQQPGCRNQSGELDGDAPDQDWQSHGWAGVGARTLTPLGA